MEKITEKYINDAGMEVCFNLSSWGVSISNYHGRKEFVFQNSKPDTIRMIGEYLIEIADMAKKVFPKKKPSQPSNIG